MKKRSRISNFVRIILALAFLAGIVMCMILIAGSNLTNRESAILGVLLTILSTLASWILTHIYSESQHKDALEEVQEQHKTNLRTYALKAAEKVNNLSNELNKLALYLEQELSYTEYSSTEVELQAKEERIESTIHLIRTLKSVNDTSLSDWEGVIGDELDQQREEREEKEEELKAVIERVEDLIENQRQDFLGKQKDTELELGSLKNDLRTALFQLSGTTLPKRVTRSKAKEPVETKCLSCSAPIQYRQRPIVRSVKAVVCKSCGKKMMSRFNDEKGFILLPREIVQVTVKCPQCSTDCEVSLDSFPNSSVTTICKSCGNTLRATRKIDTVEVKASLSKKLKAESNKELSEETFMLVKNKMPPQPWPTGVHKKIAEELRLPAYIVSRAINELIRRKVFKPQFDGVLYAPMQLENNKSEANE